MALTIQMLLQYMSEHFWSPNWLTDLSPKKPAEEATPGWGRGEILDQIGRGIPILTEHIEFLGAIHLNHLKKKRQDAGMSRETQNNQ